MQGSSIGPVLFFLTAVVVMCHQAIYHVALAQNAPIFDFPKLIVEAPMLFIAVRLVLAIENACVTRFVLELWRAALPGVMSQAVAWVFSGAVGLVYLFWNAVCCIFALAFPKPFDDD